MEHDKNTAISIIIPTHNAGTSIEKAISSVLSQTYSPNEIIVVDDGSTDHTCDILSKLIETDQIRYFSLQKSGQSHARNYGIEHAKCSWIAFLDADDYWAPDKLEKQVVLLKKYPDADWISCNFFVEKLQRNAVRMSKGEYCFDDALVALNQYPFLVWSSTVLLKRQHLINISGYDDQFGTGSDIDLWTRYAYRYPKLAYTSEVLAFYSHNLQSITQKKTPDDLLDNIEKLLKKHLITTKNESAKRCVLRMQYLSSRALGSIKGLLGKCSRKELIPLLSLMRKMNMKIPLSMRFLLYLPRPILNFLQKIRFLQVRLLLKARKSGR